MKHRLYQITTMIGEEIKKIKIYDMEIPKWKADEIIEDKLNCMFDRNKELQKQLHVKYLGIRYN